nr:hypothetical protein [Tanacetum cinerariifolium]
MERQLFWMVEIPACYDDDDDYNFVIAPNEPVNSRKMGDGHLDTVSTTESNEFIKSSVENLIPNPVSPRVKMSSLSDEDFSKEIYSNPLFDEEIIYMRIDPHHFIVESDLIESLPNHDSSIISSSSKIDSLFDEFVGELALLKSILPGFDETDFHHENETHFTKRLLYGIEEDDYDSKRDILILKELLDNYSLSLPENESFHFDIPSSSHPLTKPPDGNTEILNIKMMGDIFSFKKNHQ